MDENARQYKIVNVSICAHDGGDILVDKNLDVDQLRYGVAEALVERFKDEECEDDEEYEEETPEDMIREGFGDIDALVLENATLDYLKSHGIFHIAVDELDRDFIFLT